MMYQQAAKLEKKSGKDKKNKKKKDKTPKANKEESKDTNDSKIEEKKLQKDAKKAITYLPIIEHPPHTDTSSYFIIFPHISSYFQN